MFSSDASTQAATPSAPTDPYFEYVTLLLHGDGTNGGQNNTFIDSSTNALTVTRNGNTTQGSFSPFGTLWSNYFDGSSYLQFADNTAFTLTADFTIECWFFVPSTPTGNCNLISKWAANQEFILEYGVRSASNARQVRFFWAPFSGASAFLTSPNDAFVIGTWNHVAITRSGSSCTMWINGSSVATGTNGTAATDGSSVLRVATYSGGTADFVTGYISNVRIVKGTAVYTSTFTPSTTPLTAVTNTVLLTCQSNRFVDNSTNNFAVTVGGSPSVQRFSPFNPPAAYSTATIGGSAYFDGASDYLTVPHVSGLAPTGDFTIEFWAYPLSGSGVREWYSKGYGIQVYSSGTAWYAAFSSVNSDPASYYINTTFGSLVVGAWQYITVTRSGNSYVGFVNGVATSLGTSATAPNTGTSVVSIGDFAPAVQYPVLGYMSNVRFVNGSAVYGTTTFTPPTSPLTAITNTNVLLSCVNGAIFDNAMLNDLETMGSAQISTSVTKYGTGSLYFNGTAGTQLQTLNTNFAFGTGNFTIEFWCYGALQGDKFFIDFRGRGAAGPLHITTGGYGGTTVGAVRYTNGTITITSGTTVVTDSTWHFVAIVRNGTTVTIYVDGVSRGSGTDSTNYSATNSFARIGANSYDGNEFTGYFDDFRITKGIARYTANFTPPTAAFPDQ